MTVSQTQVRNLPAGKIGQLYGNPRLYHEESFKHLEDRASQVVTVTPSVANDTTYTLEVFGETIEFTSDAAATAVEIANGIADAINANIVARGVAEAEATESNVGVSGIDEVTITANYPGIDLEVEESDANLATTEDTAENDGSPLPFGRVVVSDGSGGVRLFTSGDTAADIVGISRYTYSVQATTVGDALLDGYPIGEDASILLTGRIFVEGGDAATKSSDLWVGTAANEEGKLFTADPGSGVQVTDGSVKWKDANVIEIKKGL